MADYKNMTAIEALREAKDASGMTAESIAQGVGITATHLRRYLDPNDNYAPSLHIIPGLCRVMRNTILLQWLEAQLVADDACRDARGCADGGGACGFGPWRGAADRRRGAGALSEYGAGDPFRAWGRDRGVPERAGRAATTGGTEGSGCGSGQPVGRRAGATGGDARATDGRVPQAVVEGVEVMMSVVPKNPYENTSHGTRCFRAGKKELG